MHSAEEENLLAWSTSVQNVRLCQGRGSPQGVGFWVEKYVGTAPNRITKDPRISLMKCGEGPRPSRDDVQNVTAFGDFRSFRCFGFATNHEVCQQGFFGPCLKA